MLTTSPEYILWNYTYHCNLNCGHCYSRAASYPTEVSYIQALEISDNINRAGVFKVALGGGEVLFRNDVLEIINNLSSSGIFVSITSNGWPITKAMSERLSDAGIGEVYISIDSMIPAIHDAMRGRKGTLNRAIDAISHLKSAEISTKISAVLTKNTIGGLDQIIDFAESRHLDEVNFKRFRPSGNGYGNRNLFEIEEIYQKSVLRKIADLKKTSSIKITLNFGIEENEIDSGCLCGIRALTIRPNGDVALCSYSDSVLGNLVTDELADIWINSPILKSKRLGASCEAIHGSSAPSEAIWASIG